MVNIPPAPRDGHEETDEELAGFSVGPKPTFACPGCRPEAALFFLSPDRQRWANGSLYLPQEVYARLVRWMDAKLRVQESAKPINKVRVWQAVSAGLKEWPERVQPATLDDAARLLTEQQQREADYQTRLSGGRNHDHD